MRKLLFLSLVFLVIASCSRPDSIQIGGSTTVLPIITMAAEEYQSHHPDQSILVNSGGSGVAINQVATGQLAIGMISRDLTREEVKRQPIVNFRKHIIGRDAVLPVVSADIYNAGITSLSFEEMRKIFSGEITNWSQLNGPDREILVIDKERARGTRHVFMEAVTGNSETSVPAAGLVLGANNELQLAITQSRSAFSMLSFAWQNDDVKGLGIRTEEGDIIEPTEENIREGRYPILRDIMLLTNGNPNEKAGQFIEFLLSEAGQEIVEKAGYVRINQ
jgi:phosphate transport system substrate-binding protein